MSKIVKIRDLDSKIIELASYLAHDKVLEMLLEEDDVYKNRDAEPLEYADKAQDIFNKKYDHFKDKIEKFIN